VQVHLVEDVVKTICVSITQYLEDVMGLTKEILILVQPLVFVELVVRLELVLITLSRQHVVLVIMEMVQLVHLVRIVVIVVRHILCVKTIHLKDVTTM
jgi:hypothetical protein